MPRLRWEEDIAASFGCTASWRGFMGTVEVSFVSYKSGIRSQPYIMWFNLGVNMTQMYTKLSSAKRGAERMLDKFLRDAGLEVKS